MPRFTYRAIAADGRGVTGRIDASSSERVAETLRARGQWAVEIREEQASGAWWNAELLGGSRLRGVELALFAREMSTLLRAGVPLDRALTVMLDLDARPAARKFIAGVQRRVKNGADFSDALAASGDSGVVRHVGLLRAGEAGGSLPDALAQLADFLERAERTRGVIRSALAYPLLVISVAIAALAFLIGVVLPRFETVFASAGQQLPGPAAAVMAIGNWFEANWMMTAIAIVGLTLALISWRRTESGALALSRGFMATPIVGSICAMMDAARFCRTLSLMLVSGVPTLKAVEHSIGAMTSVDLRARAARMIGDVKSGAALSDAMSRSGAFSKLALNMARVGEESGALPDMLSRAAELYESTAERRSRQAVQMIAPAATIGLGLLVAAIIVSMMSAMLKINDLV